MKFLKNSCCQLLTVLSVPLRSWLLFVKKTFAFILLAAFVAQSFNNTFIVFSFYLNQKKIAATLCENRYRPMLHCDGKCQLAKKIKQEENKNNQNPERKLENKNEVVSSKTYFITGLYFLSKENTYFKRYSANKLEGASMPVFHPPSTWFFLRLNSRHLSQEHFAMICDSFI